MLTRLEALLDKPDLDDPNLAGLYRALWDDEHISQGMLASHLDPTSDGATSNHAFVAESVRWIAELAPPPEFRRLLDLGCGPGVYAELFAGAGYSVTGIDFSRRSIAYAKEQAELSGSGIAYLCQDYLTLDYQGRFDLVTLINKDYPVLPSLDRVALLAKVHEALRPGGRFIFDLLTPRCAKPEGRTWSYHPTGGFFCAEPHLLLEAVHHYADADQTELSQYIVLTDADASCYLSPNHYLTRESLTAELGPLGFSRIDLYGDVTGQPYSESGETICCVLTK